CPDNEDDCKYPDPTFGCADPDLSGEMKCETGLWKSVPSSAIACAAPGPGCPTLDTANGFTCPAGAVTGTCTYADCTDASVVFTCVDGHLKTPTPLPSCDGGGDASDDASDAGADG